MFLEGLTEKIQDVLKELLEKFLEKFADKIVKVLKKIPNKFSENPQKTPTKFLRNNKESYKIHVGSLGKKILILFMEKFEKSLEEILIKNIKGILEGIPRKIPTNFPGAIAAGYFL